MNEDFYWMTWNQIEIIVRSFYVLFGAANKHILQHFGAWQRYFLILHMILDFKLAIWKLELFKFFEKMSAW